MVLNVIDPVHSRYIIEEDDLEKFLKDKFGKDYPDYNYDISVWQLSPNITLVTDL